MKIVVLDGYTINPGDLSWDRLSELGELEVYDRTSYDPDDIDLIVKRSKDADAIIVNKTPITRDVMDKLTKLKYIGVLATGYNIVDVEAAKKKGIVVTNVPDYGTNTVAQMTFALLLELTNHVGHHNQKVKEGKWTQSQDWCFWEKSLVELSDKTIGILGYGRIGRKVAEIARAFGMKVIATVNNPTKRASEDNVEFVNADTLFTQSDVISLHCPLTPETKGIINKDSIEKMKSNAIIINTARGPLIIEDDLADALGKGKIAGAAVDVASVEPIDAGNPLLKAKNCIVTPHIAWATREARIRLLNSAIENLEMFLKGSPINRV